MTETYDCRTSEGCSPPGADPDWYPRGEGDRAHCADTRKKHRHGFPQCAWCESYDHPQTEDERPGWRKVWFDGHCGSNLGGLARTGGYVWIEVTDRG